MKNKKYSVDVVEFGFYQGTDREGKIGKREFYTLATAIKKARSFAKQGKKVRIQVWGWGNSSSFISSLEIWAN